jgi:glycosyltransferase involved in cell wall biosynthesis
MAKLLTVGLPVYNSMPYLPEAMESLLAQTSKDFNILAIVDDCTDGSVEYMESIRDPRLRIIRQPKSGLTPTLNRMLRELDTPWLVRQDTDDVSYPNRIERLLEYVQQYPDAGLFYSIADYHPKDQCVGQFRCTRGTPEELRKLVKAGYLLTLCHTSVALNAEKALAVGGYRKEVYVEDADMWWRMALEYDIRFIPETLVGFRHNPHQSTSRFMLPQMVHGLYVQYLLLSKLWSLEAQSADRIESKLESMISSRDMKAKSQLREFNIRLSQKRYLPAVSAALQSFLSSPSFFTHRVFEEFQLSGAITNGVNPKLYLNRKAEFWP